MELLLARDLKRRLVGLEEHQGEVKKTFSIASESDGECNM